MPTEPLPFQILPSILAADFTRLGEEIRRAEEAGADGLHLDIMDGHFVRNISFGPDVVRAVRRCTRLPLSVHLMIQRPDLYVREFAEAGANLILIHVEAPCDVRNVLRDIRGLGIRAGLTLNPETPLECLWTVAEASWLDEVLLMTVHPGFGGQKFLRAVVSKIRALREQCPRLDISVDGGIGNATAAECAAVGANVFIAGTTLFRAADMRAAIQSLRKSIQAALGATEAKG